MQTSFCKMGIIGSHKDSSFLLDSVLCLLCYHPFLSADRPKIYISNSRENGYDNWIERPLSCHFISCQVACQLTTLGPEITLLQSAITP